MAFAPYPFFRTHLDHVHSLLPFLPALPKERYVKMYVTSVKRVMGVQFCREWVVRVPVKPATAIVDEDVTFVCARKMHPYAPGSTPEPQETMPRR